MSIGQSLACLRSRGRPYLRRVVAVQVVGLGIATTLFCHPTQAAPPDDVSSRRVIVILDRPRDPFLERIRDEISALGLTIVPVRATGALEAIARAQHAVVAIRMAPSRKGVEIWMADAISGRSLLRQLVVDESRGGPDQGLVALQTAELLRTSLLSRSSPDEPSSPVPPQVAPPVRSAAPHPPQSQAMDPVAAEPRPKAPSLEATPARSALQVGVGTTWSPGGTGADVRLWMSLQRFWTQRLGLALDVSVPLRAAYQSGVEGTSALSTHWAGVALLTQLRPPESPLFATVGAGVAALWVRARGTPNPPLVGDTDDTVSGLVYLRFDAGYRPASWTGFGIRAVAGTSLHEVHLRFAGNAAGRWGMPWVGGVLFSEVRW